MSAAKYRRIVLVARPSGEPRASDFRLEEVAMPVPAEGQVLMRVHLLSLDPYMRGRMNADGLYTVPIPLGELMIGRAVAQIIESKNASFAEGDFVWSNAGWQEYALSDGTDIRKLDPAVAPLSTALGVLGMPGLTAYAGLLTIAQPREGETVVVAAATGPVGSAVGQLAKIKGARAVGVAGGAEKCRALVEEFGFDAAVDHRDRGFAEKLKQACPRGVDIYFENVSGKVFDMVLPLLNQFARVPVCGLASDYNRIGAPTGPDRFPDLMNAILYRRLTLRGFIVADYVDKLPDFRSDMVSWLRGGKLKYREDISAGLESAPEALIALLRGQKVGKALVRVAPFPA